MPAFDRVFTDEQIWALVSYIRALQRGKVEPIPVPAPAERHLAQADPQSDTVARGAAVYFAQGCHRCHGPEADAPGSLRIRGRIDVSVVRVGDPAGMPRFGVERISPAELADLEAFLLRFALDDPAPAVASERYPAN